MHKISSSDEVNMAKINVLMMIWEKKKNWEEQNDFQKLRNASLLLHFRIIIYLGFSWYPLPSPNYLQAYEIFQNPHFFEMTFSSKPARWINIMRHHWKELLSVSPFVQDDLSNNWRTLYCRLTSSLFHYVHAAILLTVQIFTNAVVWIFHVNLFLQMKEILSQNALKNLKPHFVILV